MNVASVKEIGQKALHPDDKLIILFGEEATKELKQFSVIQKVIKEKDFDLKEGDTILFDDASYTIKKVGPHANKHLNEMSHVSLVFSEVEEDHNMANALYLEPYHLPNIQVDTVIKYQ